MSGRLRRSVLATPASNPRMIGRALASAADGVFLDLEDAVAPDEKDSARERCIEALRNPEWGAKARSVRINQIGSPHSIDDILEIVGRCGSNLDSLIIPKIQRTQDLTYIDTLLTELERKWRLAPGRIRLEVLIEDAVALSRIEDIAQCCARLDAMVLGYGDLSASLRTREAVMASSPIPDMWHYARARFVTACRASGIQPIDGAHPDFRDLTAVLRDARWSAAMGMAGKWVIHPAQIDVVNRVFTPSPAEVDHARRALAALKAAIRAGRGSAEFEGSMIDAASVRTYQDLIDFADATTRSDAVAATP
ncbi:HpcH/HpaI aldolase/citrate lyase family protein [Mycobacterium palustre]|nr:CoA ester lyase [Mycobacterium palustre]